MDRETSGRLIAPLAAIFILHLLLLAPTYPENIVPAAFLFLALELPVVIFLIAMPLGRLIRSLLVAALTIFAVVKLANIVAYLVLARPFNPMVDLSLVPIALETLAKNGVLPVALVVLGALVTLCAVAAVFAWIARCLSAPTSRLAALGIGVAVLALGLGLRATPWRERAVTDAAAFVETQIANVARSRAAAAQFERDVAADPFRDIPGERLLTRLKGNDVLLIFVEAYGRTALDDPKGSPAVQLAQSETALREAGYAMRSSWLVSPTFGGASWLAHGTFVAGLWIEDHQRYNMLFASEHKTLVNDFGRAGWRTVAVMPLFTRPWPEGKFFDFSEIYTANNLGYAGPPFGYITMPDQYVLSAFHAREMTAADRKPVMVEMALNSSHLPWTPRPHFLPWEAVGDGAGFATAREGEDVDVDWLAPQKMRDQYEKAITYAIKTVFSYAETQVKKPALIIILGDHQPIPFVAGTSASHDVPIHILSRDPALLASFEGWSDGLMPGSQSPVWKMDAMRGHILKTFSEPSP